MYIHVVQAGETIYSIAKRYGVSVTRLIIDNGLLAPHSLVVGQTIVIVYPDQIYTVQKGDTLTSIAMAQGVTPRQLLRNNPFLSDRDVIYPGETLVIDYRTNKTKISTNGYAYPFIDKAILRKTLPFLTYLSIFNHRATADGEIIGIDDTEIIKMAKEYGVAPIMLLSTLTDQGIGSKEVAYTIFSNEDIIDRHIDNILSILNTKGYYGLNVTFEFLTEESRVLYEKYFAKLTSRLNKEGYPVVVTIAPVLLDNELKITKVDYSVIGQTANGVMIMTYNWGYSIEPPGAVTSVGLAREYFDYIITLIPKEKIYVGMPVIAYNWPLPFEKGTSRAYSLNTDSAIALAGDVGAIIQYDEKAQAAFFGYVDNNFGVPIQHIVWFKDARSIDAIVGLVPEYGLKGVGIWNIMHYFTQMWLVINSQYDIETVDDLE